MTNILKKLLMWLTFSDNEGCECDKHFQRKKDVTNILEKEGCDEHFQRVCLTFSEGITNIVTNIVTKIPGGCD